MTAPYAARVGGAVLALVAAGALLPRAWDAQGPTPLALPLALLLLLAAGLLWGGP